MDIILLDASLELVPDSIRNHPSVIKNSERFGKDPGRTLLDKSLHYHAMTYLPNREKRGRPDILHSSLVLLLSEPSFRGDLYIHTLESKIIRVDRRMRPPKNYLRFVGLMEQLLVEGRVPPRGNPLMELLDISLKELVEERGLVLLHEEGERRGVRTLCGEKAFLGVGAFPHGEFSEEVKLLARETVSISEHVLETQNVICRLLCGCSLSHLG